MHTGPLLVRLLLLIGLVAPMAPAQLLTDPPTLYTVGPGQQFPSLQGALTATAGLIHEGYITPVQIRVSSGTYVGPLVLDLPDVEGLLILDIRAKGKVVLSAPGDTVLTKTGQYCLLALTKLRFEVSDRAFASTSDIDLSIDRCRFSDITGTAVDVDPSLPDPGAVAVPSSVELWKSRFDRCGAGLDFDAALYEGGNSDLVVERCKFNQIGSTAVRASANTMTIERNAIQQVAVGIDVTPDFGFVERNTIRGATTLGIHCRAPFDNGHNASIRRNKVLKGPGAGMLLDTTEGGGLFSGENRITMMGGIGVHVIGPDAPVDGAKLIADLYRERIVAPGDIGVLLEAGNVDVIEVRVTKAAIYGFRVEAPNNEFSGCRASKTGPGGFGLSDTAGGNTYDGSNTFDSVDPENPGSF